MLNDQLIIFMINKIHIAEFVLQVVYVVYQRDGDDD